MKKMYEVAQRYEDGHIVRGGIKTSMATALKWAKHNIELCPDEDYIVVEADENAITWREYLAECKAYAEG